MLIGYKIFHFLPYTSFLLFLQHICIIFIARKLFSFFSKLQVRVKFHRFIYWHSHHSIRHIKIISYNNEQLANDSMYTVPVVFNWLSDYIKWALLISGPLPSSMWSKASFAYVLHLACKALSLYLCITWWSLPYLSRFHFLLCKAFQLPLNRESYFPLDFKVLYYALF